MKKTKKMLALMLAFALTMSVDTYASNLKWLNLQEHQESQLLSASNRSSQDVIQYSTRGEILAEGSVEIVNKEDGTIYISIETMAHRNVDQIYQTAFLDQWNEKNQDWVQVDMFEFEKSKSEDENLHMLINTFIVSGYPANKYYRVRGLHVVELGDEMEGCATETNGVLITKR